MWPFTLIPELTQTGKSAATHALPWLTCFKEQPRSFYLSHIPEQFPAVTRDTISWTSTPILITQYGESGRLWVTPWDCNQSYQVLSVPLLTLLLRVLWCEWYRPALTCSAWCWSAHNTLLIPSAVHLSHLRRRRKYLWIQGIDYSIAIRGAWPQIQHLHLLWWEV